MIILVADDDRLIRFTIKSMLKELLGDAGAIFLEAANGRDMVSVCREKRPDVAFVDIHMPYLDGLEAIAESKKCSKNTEYVIVSGYSDFSYAQKGIRLGVHEYILKPVDENQLASVMEKLKEKLKMQKNESNSRFQLRLMNAFHYGATVGLEEYEQEQENKNYQYLVFQLYIKTGRDKRELSVYMQKKLLKEIRKMGEEVVARKGYYVIANTLEGTPCAIFGVPDELLGYVIARIRKISREAARERDSFFYFQWFRAKDVKEICTICDKADDEAYLGMQREPGEVLEYDTQKIDANAREFLKLVDQLLGAWEQADGIACREVMNTLWRSFRERVPQVNLKNVSGYCSFITGCSIQHDSLKKFCQSFVEQSENMYRRREAREEGDIIEQVKAYIQQYYMNDISISQIAEHFKLTANYLSAIFHRRAGCKFIDYLTEIRIDAAKKLLIKNPTASIQDIALLVGYNSARHFSSLFQKQVGMTPSAYRKESV